MNNFIKEKFRIMFHQISLILGSVWPRYHYHIKSFSAVNWTYFCDYPWIKRFPCRERVICFRAGERTGSFIPNFPLAEHFEGKRGIVQAFHKGCKVWASSFFFFYILCLTDIGSWLELFGFQLHNVLPGFPKPELENLELTYELLQLQTKTQEWDPGKVCKNFTISIYP